jgi:TolB protein
VKTAGLAAFLILLLSASAAACNDEEAAESSSTPGASFVPVGEPGTFLLYREASGSLVAQDLATNETYRQEVDYTKEVLVSAQCTDDGARIAYLRQQFDETDRVLDIRGEDAPGDPIPVSAAVQGIAWSPDGDTIAISEYDGDGQVFLVRILDPLTGDSREVASGPGFVAGVTWSPDGTRLAYNLQEIESGASRIFSVEPDTGYIAEMAPAGDYQWYDPDWSDAGKVVLVSGGNKEGFQLYEIQVSSGTYSAITDSDIFKRGAQYSPEGDLIAYTGSIQVPSVSRTMNALHSFGIFMANADGSDERSLTADPRLNPGAAVDPYLDAYFVGWCRKGPWLDDDWERGAPTTPVAQ